MTGVGGAAVVLAAFFALAAARKAAATTAVAEEFQTLGLPRSPLLVVAVSVLEALAATALVVRPAVGGPLALVMLVGFSMVLVAAIRRGSEARCGCFGASARRSVGRVDLVRNAGLAALAVLAVIGASDGIARPDLPGLVAVTSFVAPAFVVGQLLELRNQIGSIFRIELAGEVT